MSRHATFRHERSSAAAAWPYPRNAQRPARGVGGGVTRSLALDAHGKSLSSALPDLEIGGGFGDTGPVP